MFRVGGEPKKVTSKKQRKRRILVQAIFLLWAVRPSRKIIPPVAGFQEREEENWRHSPETCAATETKTRRQSGSVILSTAPYCTSYSGSRDGAAVGGERRCCFSCRGYVTASVTGCPLWTEGEGEGQNTENALLKNPFLLRIYDRVSHIG
jgi:hypothetical protein